MSNLPEAQPPPRIAVVHIITTMELGGAQQNTLYTISHLDPRRFRAILIAGPEGMLWPEAEKLHGVSVYCVETLQRDIHPIRDVMAMWKIFRLLKRLGKESGLIVHTHSSKAGILGRAAAWAAGTSVIIHSIHGYGFQAPRSRILQAILVAAERLMAHITTHFIAVSHANIKEGESLGLFRRAGVSLIRSGIHSRAHDAGDQDSIAIRNGLGVSELAPLVGMVACLKPQKAPLDFIRLAAAVQGIVPDARFILVGDGELRSEVQQLVLELHLEEAVILAGWRRDIAKVLNVLDVFVLTSRWEGLPRALLEALSAGLPVVATGVDGTVEALENIGHGRRGYLVQPGGISVMAERVLDIIRKRNGAPVKVSPEGILPREFDIDEMVHLQEQLYNELLCSIEGKIAA